MDPLAVLRRSVSRTLALESATFTLEHQKGATILFPGVAMRKVSGVVDIPDKFRLTVEADLTSFSSFLEINIAVVGDLAYMTDFITEEWRQASPEFLPFSFANLGQTLADIIEAVEAPALVGTERLRGYTAHRIKGRIYSDDLSALVPGSSQGLDVGLELWLDQSEGLLFQALITGTVMSTDATDPVRLLTLDNIDVPVNITLPR